MDQGNTVEPPEDAVDSARASAPPLGFDWMLPVVLILGALLILLNLGETALWTDEAEAAWLGESILEHGVPDGLRWPQLPLPVGGRQARRLQRRPGLGALALAAALHVCGFVRGLGREHAGSPGCPSHWSASPACG